jgi:hypothetical protein
MFVSFGSGVMTVKTWTRSTIRSFRQQLDGHPGEVIGNAIRYGPSRKLSRHIEETWAGLHGLHARTEDGDVYLGQASIEQLAT